MKKIFLILLLFFIVFVISADESGSASWHSQEALYRLEVKLNASKDYSFIDNRRICLPAGFENGVRVYNSVGLKMPAHQYLDGGVLLPPVDRDSVFYVYFGFPEKQEFESMPDAVDNQRLMLFQTEPEMALLPKDWERVETGKCRREINNYARNQSKPWLPCEKKNNCRVLRRIFNGCKNSILPVCARNMALKGYNSKSTLWKATPPGAVFCCRIYLMMPSFKHAHSHYPCRESNMKGQLRNYWNVCRRNNNRIAEIKKTNPEDGLEQSLFDAFSGGSPKRLESGQVFLPKRPFDTGWRFIVLFRGNLVVPETGEYEFMAKSNATRILRIDGKHIIREYGETPNTEIIGTESSATIKLEKGIHKFELIYHKQTVSTWISASWRKKGEGHFETLNEENFSPANPPEVLSLVSRAGLKYPLFQRHDKFVLFTGKQEKYYLNGFEALTGADGVDIACKWQLDGQEYPTELNVIALKDGEEHTLSAIPDTPGYTPLTISFPPSGTPRIPVRPDLFLKLWAPFFLYDDETLDFYTELRSRLPLELNVGLKAFIGKTSENTKGKEVLTIVVPPLQQEHVDRFASDILLKYPMKINGASFQGKSSYSELSVYIPGLVFDSKKLAVLPLKDIGKINCREDGFYENDTRIVPLLHRPNLHELRAWELPKTITMSFQSVKKIFVIAEDFGTLRADLEKLFASKKIVLEFHAWKNSPDDNGRGSLESIPSLFDAIRSTDADMALIIPMTQSRRKTISMREEGRLIAFLLQALRELSPVRSIKLAPPFPSHPRYADPSTDLAFVDMLRDFKREYGIDFLELNAEYKRMPGFEDSYTSQIPGEPDSLFPNGESARIAKLIQDWLLKIK